jgi:hypothetical protein
MLIVGCGKTPDAEDLTRSAIDKSKDKSINGAIVAGSDGSYLGYYLNQMGSVLRFILPDNTILEVIAKTGKYTPNGEIVYLSTDCSGSPYTTDINTLPNTVIFDGGSRYFKVSKSQPSLRTSQSLLADGVCKVSTKASQAVLVDEVKAPLDTVSFAPLTVEVEGSR